MNFLPQDSKRAVKEAQAFESCMLMATMHGYKNEYKQVATYLEAAARSVKELDRLQKKKESYEKAKILIKQIESQQQVDRLTFELRNEYGFRY